MNDTKAYGFAVSMLRATERRSLVFRRFEEGDVSHAIADDVVVVARHYPATPESDTEKQPIITPSGVLAYEGRVDNREQIAYALGQPRLAHLSDGAVLAAAYDTWGAKLSAKVIGEYAYVVLDRREHQLVAGQDSLAIRRVFYSSRGDRVLVTSNLRLLFEMFPQARPPFDREVLCEYFAGPMSPWSGRNIWRGVRELGRGNVVVQRGNDLQEQQVWRPDPNRRMRHKPVAEVDEAFRELLFQGVRGALRSSAPVLCELSGGHDSSTVCSVAARLSLAGEGPGIIAWSLIDKRSNETGFQDAVRRQYQIASHTLDLGSYLPFQDFTDSELPTLGFVQMGAVERAMREFARSRGIRSRVTGHAADALFNKTGAAPMYLSEWLREGRLIDWARDFRAHLRNGSFSGWRLLRDCSVGTVDMRAGRRRVPPPNWLTPKFRKEIQQADYDYVHAVPRVLPSDAREALYRTTLAYMPYNGRALPDERMPLLYRPLVEFILGLDWEHIARPGEDRVLMRRSLRGILPESVRAGGSRSGFGPALLEGLRVAWPRIAHFVTGDQLADLGVVERKPFKAALEAMRAGYSGPNTRVSSAALNLETWLGLKALESKRRTTESDIIASDISAHTIR